jgi:pSer/pThr/pTyr-binding forkhead associated (FHA) protein
MSQQPPQHPEGDQRGQHGGYGYDQGQEKDPAYGQQYGYGPGPGYNQSYDPGYAGQQGGYGHDQGQGHHQQYGYDQGYGSGHDPDQGQGQNQGYVQQGGYDQNYDQSYDQYGGARGGYGYDQNQGYDGGYSGDPGAQEYAPPAVQTGTRQLTAVLSLDDGSNRSYQLALGSNVVGRGQDAQFRLPDTGVSRRHLEITWDGQVAMLADLGSTNGTTVNGSPIQTWQLADGDVLRIGHSSLVFHVQG